MLSVMLEIIPSFPGHQFLIASAPSVKREFYTSLIGRAEVGIVSGQTYDLLSNSVAALVTSGTATLETALMNVPQLVCYKGNPLSYQIARRLVKVDFISLVNLIAGHQVVKELIQDDFNPPRLAAELKQLLEPAGQSDISEGYSRVKALLGGKGASGRTAARIIQYLSRKSVNKQDN